MKPGPRLVALLLICLPFAAPLLAAREDDLSRIKERELEEVRQRISELKQSMDARFAERDRVTGELQAAEIRIAEKRIELKELRRQQEVSERRKQELEAELARLQADLDREAEQLAAQVRAAYMSGGQERIKLLLNQQDPAALGRLLAYYRYLSDYRGDNISRMSAHLREVARVRAAVAEEEARLAQLARARYAELTELNEAQEERQALLVRLKERLAEEGAEVERLAAQEQDLARLIRELTSILSDYPITSEEPFSALKGRLTWPIAGRLLHDFGQPRAGGGLNWKGVVLAAPRGREVRTIYHGRVVFADWLAGMGLLVIVDHGEGFMTLYGYNESILASPGDWVAPGDVIATVGDSGGQQQASLYFEIRRGTEAVDPRGWVTRQPQTG
ncbi:MAG: peptidoglycan DD-metalloendopeptidase family protein [Woeseiaceae bacterium]|nr:peptidoglycan DD-metalloendopeptidase family protein [Woeseiaceae bacterium]